jgi:hypothetical protein
MSEEQVSIPSEKLPPIENVDNTAPSTLPQLSKNQIKKLKRKEAALALKAERRKRERELRKQKRKNGLAVMEKPDSYWIVHLII